MVRMKRGFNARNGGEGRGVIYAEVEDEDRPNGWDLRVSETKEKNVTGRAGCCEAFYWAAYAGWLWAGFVSIFERKHFLF